MYGMQADVLPLTEDAYAAVLRRNCRATEHQQELSLDTIYLLQYCVKQRHAVAQNGKTQIDEHSIVVPENVSEREGYIEEMSRRSIIEKQVRIDTDGDVVGQVNGLTVITVGGTEFGEPSRITATIHYGDGDIIDIERKSEMSGNIHTKGVMILSAYLAHQFARHEPMSVSATVVFEQSYFEVDGDSASMAELCCLISALAETPLTQSLAITGAMDQFGNVQAIGAVNEKIEGYFALCKERGLTGEHGVIIPASNQAQLNLAPEIIEAVEHGKFSVHTVEHVEEALELLTGVSKNELFDRVRGHIHDPDEQQRKPWWKRLFD